MTCSIRMSEYLLLKRKYEDARRKNRWMYAINTALLLIIFAMGLIFNG